MGVNGLWDILGVLSTREKNAYLHDKKVAVDLSVWIVQAERTGYKDAVSFVFERASYLVQNNVHPIFVRDSKEPPELKKRALEGKGSVPIRSHLYECSEKCADLLDAMGIQCLTSKGEGEALCALLCSNGIVDGVITEDGDALLYGAHTIYRNFRLTKPKAGSPEKGNKGTQSTSDPDKSLKVCALKNNSLHLDRSTLVALALLLGCEYVKGVPGIGIEYAKRLLKDLEGIDLLQRLHDWKRCKSELFPGNSSTPIIRPEHCTVCLHIGTTHEFEGCDMCKVDNSCYKSDLQIPCSCSWCMYYDICQKRNTELKAFEAVMSMEDFPNEEVINEYMNYKDEVPEELPDLKCPNLQKLQSTFRFRRWDHSKSFRKFFPLITAWQMFKLCKDPSEDRSSMLYEPVKIIGHRKDKGEQKLKVQWSEGKDQEDKHLKHLQTFENEEFFKKAYPQIANLFYESKAKPKGTSTAKGSKSTETNKITDHFKQSKIGNEQVSDKLTSNNSAKRNLEPEFNNTSPEKKMCLDRKREDL